MADTVTCPVGGEELPRSTTYCKTHWTEVPPPPPPEPDPYGETVTCPNCGSPGRAGQECDQCMAVLPAASTGSSTTAILGLPAGATVLIPRGREILIGRQSDFAEIRQGLEPIDVVSRRHCYVTVSTARDEVTVRDPDSVNRTWVGDDPVEIRPDESRTAVLPARIRLGLETFITIAAGEA